MIKWCFLIIILFYFVVNQPHCKNGGMKNEDECKCIEGFTGNQCFNKTCSNQGKLNEFTNECQCTNKWSGNHCLSCINDNSCGDGSYCNRSMIMKSEKYMSCNVLDIDIAEFFGNQLNIFCKDNVCGMQIWTNDSLISNDNKYQQVFYCNYNQCQIIEKKTDERVSIINYNCDKTQCECIGPIDKCNTQVKTIIDHLTGYTNISCIENHCTIKQQKFPWEIPIQCNTGECVPKTNLQIEEPDFIKIFKKHWIVFTIIIVLIVGFLFILITSCVLSCLHTREAIRQYKNENIKKISPLIQVYKLDYIMKEWKCCFCIKSNKKILNNINLEFKPNKENKGNVIAVIGRSGAGKSTLLDILANRKKSGIIDGDIEINGEKFDDSYSRFSGYVASNNFFIADLTVWETLMFCANTRLPKCITDKEKKARVENVLIDMELTDIKNSRVGDKNRRGISDGEKKRLAIAMELIIEPSILILDEPTSGLDYTNALNVTKKLADLSSEKRLIIYSIHQPSIEIWNHCITDVLLLARGKKVWFGKKEHLIDTIGFSNPNHIYQISTNPADYAVEYLKTLDNIDLDKIQELDTILSKKKKVIEENEDLNEKEDEIIEINTNDDGDILDLNRTLLDDDFYKGIKVLKYATSFWSQFFTLTGRNIKVFFRNPLLLLLHLSLSIIIGLGLGFLYYGLDYDIAGCQSRIGIIYFITLILSLSPLGSLDIFMNERYTYKNEIARGYYKSSAYFFSKILFDLILLRIIPSIIMGSTCYYMVGLNNGIYHFSWFIIIITLINCVSALICISISSFSSDMGFVSVIFIYIQLFGTLFGGLFMNNDGSSIYTSWIHYGSFWYYALEALLINEFHDTEVLINPKGTSLKIPAYGDFYLNQFGMDSINFTRDILILLGIFIALIVISGVLLKFLIKEKS